VNSPPEKKNVFGVKVQLQFRLHKECTNLTTKSIMTKREPLHLLRVYTCWIFLETRFMQSIHI